MRTIILSLFALFIAISINATTYTVTNTNDSGTGSLRQAITSANASPNSIVVFNIPTTDAGYNATTGVFTINIASLLPPVQNINMTIDGTTQPNNTNPNGPEICIKGNGTLSYGFCLPTTGNTVKGFIINGFQTGVLIYKTAFFNCNTNTVSDCYLGVNYNATVADPNEIGVAIYSNATNNTVKNNVISGNTLAGVGIRTSSANIVQGNKIGTDRTGMVRIPNYYGVAIDSSYSNTVGGTTAAQRNYISGNAFAGVAINTNISHDNVIKGNYIGTNVNALAYTDTICNYYGIAISDSYNNIIGGTTAAERNIISGNSDGGIAIMETLSVNNSIKGNFIGTNVNGNDSIPNANGILISGSGSNTIGGSTYGEKNVISGNHLAGIAFSYSGTRNNKIIGNYIGTDKTGMQALSNHTGIYIFSNANSNIVGGSAAGERNIISANYEMGICMEASDSNVVIGNYIGPDSTGLSTFRFSNDTLVQGNGLYFNSNASRNIAGGTGTNEGNIISGNRVYGLIYYGNSPYNSCIGNYIGVDKTGNHALPNTTGICVDGGANHNPIIGNVLSGNLAYGIFIVTTGTYYNELRGNKIGTNAAGTDSVPNQIGVILGGGTKYNIIGGTTAADRNIISGNYFDGVEVADSSTMYNNIVGNYIGTDISGTSAIPNYNGIGFATLPSRNNIENNLISGNNYAGILLYERSDSNTVYSNKIGVKSDGTSPLGNGAAGIVVSKKSCYNKIGEPSRGNIVAYNDTVGIVLGDSLSKFNTLSANVVYGNSDMGIEIYPFGQNSNDAGDSDNGCNELMNYPVIADAIRDINSNETVITGTIDYTINGGPAGIRIEVFKTNDQNIFHHGDATEYLGYTTVDGSGNWTFSTFSLALSDNITATATDLNGNTSEFALNSSIIASIDENNQSANEMNVFPNPVKDIVYINGINEFDEVVLTDYTGREISINKNHGSIDLSLLPSGIYLLNITSKDHSVRKIKLVKL